jgi:hypothetical protein
MKEGIFVSAGEEPGAKLKTSELLSTVHSREKYVSYSFRVASALSITVY